MPTCFFIRNVNNKITFFQDLSPNYPLNDLENSVKTLCQVVKSFHGDSAITFLIPFRSLLYNVVKTTSNWK